MYDAMAESVFNSWKYYRLDLEIVLIDSRIVIISFYSWWQSFSTLFRSMTNQVTALID